MTTMINNRSEQKRILKFAAVGGIGTVIDFGIFNLLTQLTPLTAVAASVISFSCAVVNNFFLNRSWTFKDSIVRPLPVQMAQFTLVSVIGLIIRTPIFATLEKVFTNLAEKFLPGFFLSPVVLAHNLALACAIVVVLIWNFIANRFWTFKDSN
jgi:putative flippase GtrA